MHRDPLVLSTSCYLCWLTSAMTSLSCRRKYLGTGHTLQQRSSLYLRSFPTIQKPWTSALETSTRKERRQGTWDPPETFILSTSHHPSHQRRGKGVFSPAVKSYTGKKKKTHWRPRKDTSFISLLFSCLLPPALLPNTVLRVACKRPEGVSH